VELIKQKVASTLRPEVLAGVGGFGAHFELDLSKYETLSWSPALTVWGPR